MPSAFDDPTQPPHDRPDAVEAELAPYTKVLKDERTTATIYPISSAEDVPVGLLAFLCDEFNFEIERGDTFPLFDTLHIDTFQNFWFGSFAGVMLIGDQHSLDDNRQWEKECLGTFYIKPNYPGRCSHICTAGFLVNAGIRRQGIGRTLTEAFLEWAPKLGYSYSQFNLVFDSNIAAKYIFESMGFQKLGKIPGAGILKGHESAVDAFMYGRQLIDNNEDVEGEARFAKIKYYLETNKYPENSDRSEKSRLRSSAAHYRLEEGRLMLKGKEVVPESDRQLEIATAVHAESHAGINKTTSQITEKYHWTRIKETVAQALRNCNECREATRPATKRLKRGYEEMSDPHLDGNFAPFESGHHTDHTLLGADLSGLGDQAPHHAANEDDEYDDTHDNHNEQHPPTNNELQHHQQQQHHHHHHHPPPPQQQPQGQPVQAPEHHHQQHHNGNEEANEGDEIAIAHALLQANDAHNHNYL